MEMISQERIYTQGRKMVVVPTSLSLVQFVTHYEKIKSSATTVIHNLHARFFVDA